MIGTPSVTSYVRPDAYIGPGSPSARTARPMPAPATPVRSVEGRTEGPWQQFWREVYTICAETAAHRSMQAETVADTSDALHASLLDVHRDGSTISVSLRSEDSKQ
jgi:hypothetical protein